MAMNWFWKNVMNVDWYHLHSLHYRLKTSCNITVYVRINSGDDVAISCKNLVNFCQVTPEKMELQWQSQVRQGQKNRRISLNISGQTESALHADDGSVPYFPICRGTLPWQPNSIAVMKANWYYVHSLHVRQMVVRFCSLLLARGRHCGAEWAIH